MRDPFHLYGTPLTQDDHFNYLGVEFTCLSISSRYPSVGLSSPPFGFRAVGLEYGMTILESGAPQLEKIRLCLKRGVCL